MRAQERDPLAGEPPAEVELLKNYKIPAASIVKFGAVDGDGNPDFLVITPSYSAYMYNNDGKELWHWDAPAADARLRGEFEAPGRSGTSTATGTTSLSTGACAKTKCASRSRWPRWSP